MYNFFSTFLHNLGGSWSKLTDVIIFKPISMEPDGVNLWYYQTLTFWSHRIHCFKYQGIHYTSLVY